MVAEPAKSFDALEAQASKVMGVFTAAGFEYVAPAIIQPADVFLDVVGEGIRGRTYVFNDPEGQELCLRPDVTVPACRLYLERYPRADQKARFCYNGPVFRFQPGGPDEKNPREFRQAGIEAFGDTDREKTEVEILMTAVTTLVAVKLNSYRIRLGDLGIFRALLDAIEMPDRWRRRLAQNFWRKDAFRHELAQLCGQEPRPEPAVTQDFLSRLEVDSLEAATAQVLAHIEERGFALQGTRRIDEVTAQLVDRARDLREPPLRAQDAALIDAYVSIAGAPRAAGARIQDLMTEYNVDLSDALETFNRRVSLLQKAGFDWSITEFSAEFGRNLEYYTGFVFQIEVPVFGERAHIAGGGRYDNLVRSVGADHDVPGVGLAIHTERLLQAVKAGI